MIPEKDGTGTNKARRRVEAEDTGKDDQVQAMERKGGREWVFSSNDLNNDDEAFDQPEKLEKPRAAIEESNNYQL